jgi:hypothetical protein
MSGRVRIANANEWSSDWHVNSSPATNTKASATQPAVPRSNPTAKRNVLTALSVGMQGGTAAPSAVQITVAVIDGSSGDTVYLWGPMTIGLPAVAGSLNGYALSNLFIEGSEYTPMTIEFSQAGGGNTFETVWMSGTTI